MMVLATPESRMAERLRAAIAFAGVGALEWDLRTGEAWWSDHLYTILGRRPDQIPTSFAAFLECVEEQDREAVRSALREVLQTGESRPLACRVVRPDGSARRCRGQVGAIPDESGRCRLILGVLRDTTDEAEGRSPEETLVRALREERRELLTVLEATPRPLLLVDSGQRILRANRATERMFGWRAGDPTGRALTILTTEPAELLDALLVEATASGGSGEISRLIPARTREGRVFPAEITVVAAPTAEAARFVVMVASVSTGPGDREGLWVGGPRPRTPLEPSPHRA